MFFPTTWKAIVKQGAIILCGGRSSRMGLPKLALPFGPEVMLQRIVRLLAEVCTPIVVVAAPGQDLPELPAGVIVARDRREGRGPLEGLSAGLRALPADVEAAFATSCDVPLLVPAFARRMFELLGDHAAAVPVSGGFQHPLAAVYRPTILGLVDELLAADRLRPAFLFDSVATRRVMEAELRDVDPELNTLRNLNQPGDYLAALEQAGFTAPPEIAAKLQERG
ncbi:MAG: molybdenum cofactor guanylyltransferase [Pirellulales bacterium]